MDNKLVMNTSVNILVVANQYFLKIHQSIHIGIHNQIHNSIHNRIHQSIHKKIHQSIHQSIHGSIHGSIHQSIHQSIHGSIHGLLSTCDCVGSSGLLDYLVLATVWDHQVDLWAHHILSFVELCCFCFCVV